MSATNPIAPKGGRNHIQTLYISPITNDASIAFLTRGTGGDEWAAVDNTGKQFKFDKIAEYTSAAGVTIDSLRIKDGGARLLNNIPLQARNAADSADLDLLYLDTSNKLVIGSSNTQINLKVGGSIYWNVTALGNWEPEGNETNAIGGSSKRIGNIYTKNIRRSGGNLEIITDDAQPVVMYTNSVAHLRLESGGNLGLWGSSYGSGTKVMFIGNASAVPSTNPSSGGILYCESGALKYRGSSGTVSTLGAA